MSRPRPIFWLAMVAALLILAGGGIWRAKVLKPLAPRAEFRLPAGELPPGIFVLTTALGGFRGLLADLLWMRALTLQEEKEVLEISLLSNWITALKPHFITPWIFHAWNMAYNISIMFPAPADRWQWVQRGISLLRDRGLVCNPGHPLLLREIGWIYQHKIGFVMDSAHRYFKARLAEDVQAVFGGPHPDYQIRPAGRAEEVARMARERLGLNLALMQRIDAAYGPLDWRLPAAHAAYWAFQGRQADARQAGVRECYQMFFQSLSDLFRHGNLFYDRKTGLYLTTPDLDLLPKVLCAYDEALAVYDTPVFREAHANFLAEAVVILYLYNRRSQAQELYARLIGLYPNPAGDPALDEFVPAAVARNMAEAPRDDVIALIEGSLFQSYLWQVLDDPERAAAAQNIAKQIWTHYMQSRVSADHLQRTGLPALPELRRLALERALRELPPDLSKRLRQAALENAPAD